MEKGAKIEIEALTFKKLYELLMPEAKSWADEEKGETGKKEEKGEKWWENGRGQLWAPKYFKTKHSERATTDPDEPRRDSGQIRAEHWK